MYMPKIMRAWVVVLHGVSGNKTEVTDCVLQLLIVNTRRQATKDSLISRSEKSKPLRGI